MGYGWIFFYNWINLIELVDMHLNIGKVFHDDIDWECGRTWKIWLLCFTKFLLKCLQSRIRKIVTTLNVTGESQDIYDAIGAKSVVMLRTISNRSFGDNSLLLIWSGPCCAARWSVIVWEPIHLGTMNYEVLNERVF